METISITSEEDASKPLATLVELLKPIFDFCSSSSVVDPPVDDVSGATGCVDIIPPPGSAQSIASPILYEFIIFKLFAKTFPVEESIIITKRAININFFIILFNFFFI